MQLGDISHNVKIDGGLHLHLHNPLEPLSVVAEIVDALQVAANFLELAAQLVEGSFEESNIIYFLKLVDRFEPLLKHLTFRQDSSFTLSGLGGPAKEVRRPHVRILLSHSSLMSSALVLTSVEPLRSYRFNTRLPPRCE